MLEWFWKKMDLENEPEKHRMFAENLIIWASLFGGLFALVRFL